MEPLLCSPELFHSFVDRHRGLESEGIVLVPEDHTDMRGSYAMVDPAGRFFDNVEARHRYSEPILARGIETAWSQVHFSMERFEQRWANHFAHGRSSTRSNANTNAESRSEGSADYGRERRERLQRMLNGLNRIHNGASRCAFSSVVFC